MRPSSRRARARSPSASPRSTARAADLETAGRGSSTCGEQAGREAEQEPPGARSKRPQPAPASDELERIEARLAELREAEQAFVRTQHELAARSDALTEQEAVLAKRERDLAASEAAAPSPELEFLEARIRRLEQGSRPRPDEAQTFSAGSARPPAAQVSAATDDPDEPLH